MQQNSPTFDNQRAWGGDRFQPGPVTPTAGHQAAFIDHDQQDIRSFPQGGVIASSSDNLFHPISHDSAPYVFNLPHVPVPQNPRFRAYNHSPFSCPLPYPSSFTSYNNPSFTLPPLPPNGQHVQNSLPMGPPPPVPPRPIFHDYHSHFVHPQNAYVPSHPPFNQFLPAYNHFVPYMQPPQPPPPSPSPSSSVTPIHHTTSSSKTLPTVTHIPVLTSKHDFFPWDEGVNALIRANGLVGHILDPSSYVDPSRPDLAPTPAPSLSLSSTPREIEASNRW